MRMPRRHESLLRRLRRWLGGAAALVAGLALPCLAAAEPVILRPGDNPAGLTTEAIANQPRWREGEVLVRFREEPTPAGRKRFLALAGVEAEELPLLQPASRRGLTSPGRPAPPRLHRLRLAPGQSMATALARLREQPDVAYAEPNYLVRLCVQPSPPRQPNDFALPRQWALDNTGQLNGTADADIHALAAWNLTTGSRDVRIAIIDSGVDYFHPDLEANIWVNPGEIPGNGLDDDRNGYIDDVHGFDFVSHDGDPMDDQGHGTHVAGIVGAVTDNDLGVAGICWQASIMALKAFDENGEAPVSDVVEAIEYAVANGARLINASWGTPDLSLALQDAIRAATEAGVLMISAAGNGRTDEPFYPSALPEVVSVAATDPKDARARFSNYGDQVDLAAPGYLIYSTLPNARYDFLSGTSMAAPHVTGVAALVLSLHPELTPAQLLDILRNAVDPIRTDHPLGTGRLNALKAVQVAGPLPTARLRLPPVLSGRVDFTGTAAGEQFDHYLIEHGDGDFPESWEVVHEGNQPVSDDVLLAGFDTGRLPEGTHTFRLTVFDHAGQMASDRAVVTVRNVFLSNPQDNDIRRAGERIVLRGTVYGANRTYRIEWGEGWRPTRWSAEGIELLDQGSHPVTDDVLGWWDTAALPPDEFYSLRLTALEEGTTVGEWITGVIHLDSRLRPGWPVALPADTFYPTNDWRLVTAADLDTDGLQEILRVQSGGATGEPAELRVYDPAGRLLWNAPLGRGEPFSDLPAVGDLDGNGLMEVITGTGEEGWVYAFHHDGTPVEGEWPVKLEVSDIAKVVADLDRDGMAEVICYARDPRPSSRQRRQLAVFDRFGKLIASWRLDACPKEDDAPQQFPAIGNFDDDRALEIVAVNGCGGLAAFDPFQPDGELWSVQLGSTFYGSPVVGDIDGDGRDDIVLAGWDPDAGRKQSVGGGVFLLDHLGQVKFGWPVLIDESFVATPALGDLDRDGRLEILVPSSQSRRVHLLEADGFDHEGWPVIVSGYHRPRSEPLIADVDGDGWPDAVLIVNGQPLHFSAYGTREALGGLAAWDRFGSPIDLHPLPNLRTLPLEQTGGYSRGKNAPPILTDLDGNGLLDVVASSIEDRAYSSTGIASSGKGRYSLYAWELPVPVTASNLVWNTFLHDPGHTGRLPRPEPVNQPPVLLPLPGQKIPVGATFFPLPLRQFAYDPDHPFEALEWSVEGNLRLAVNFTPEGLAEFTILDRNQPFSETLRFRVRDPEGAEASRTATFTVAVGYTPPQAMPDAIELDEDTEITFAPLANDRAPGNRSLELAGAGRPAHGRLEFLEDGLLRYTPQPDFFGEDTFTYTLRDTEGGMALGEVRLHVHPVPDAPRPGIDHLITNEDESAELDLLANDVEPDGQPLRITRLGLAEHGQAMLVEGRRLRYVPEPDWNGADTVRYLVSDGESPEVEAEVRIMVKPVNDPPRARDQSYTLNRNSYRDVFYDAEDPDGDSLSYEIVDGPEHGELWVAPQIATYYPHAGFVGEDRFTYKASDGRAESPVATVRFTVLDANNPPRIRDLAFTNKVGRAFTIRFSAVDDDDDPVTFEIVRPPEHGELTPDAGDSARFRYQPEPGFRGDDSFSYRAHDGHDPSLPAEVRIHITDINTPPVAREADLSVRYNTPTELELPVVDPESDPLTVRIVTPPRHGTLEGDGPTMTFTPETDYSGPDSFTFIASDGEAESGEGTVRLKIEPRNHPPEAENQTIELPVDTRLDLPLAVSDPDGDPLRLAILKGPQHGLVAGTGTNYFYQPHPGFAGIDSFTYKAWDGFIYSRVASVQLTVQRPPEPALRIERLDWSENGLRLELTAEPGRTYHLQASPDLDRWETLQTVTAEDTRLELLDPAPTPHHRFYRVVEY
ncbi:MAG: tandem-95 repeat protein [Verrucomicrobia bacterium]|nr:MAG: tandem-95 repeat protein [Verrucomicrobiota bacterium]